MHRIASGTAAAPLRTCVTSSSAGSHTPLAQAPPYVDTHDYWDPPEIGSKRTWGRVLANELPMEEQASF